MASTLPQGLSDPLGKRNFLPLQREDPSTADPDIWHKASLPGSNPFSYAGRRSIPHEFMGNTPTIIPGKTTRNPIKTTSRPPLPQPMSDPFWYPETEIERILS
jgi:hypothetical protein